MPLENQPLEQSVVINAAPAGFVRPHLTKQQALVRVIDSCIVLMSLWLSIILLKHNWPSEYDWNDLYLTYGFSGLLLFQFFAEYNEVYYSWRGALLSSQLFRIIGSWLLTLLTMMMLFFLTRAVVDTSRLAIGIWSINTLVLLTLFHAAYHYFVRIARPAERHTLSVGIVGSTALGHRLLETFTSMPALGYQFVGYYDDRKPAAGRRVSGADTRVRGGLDQLYEDTRLGKVEAVFVTLPMAAENRVRGILERLSDTTATVFYVPDLFAFNLVSSRCVMMQGIPCFSVYGSPFDQEPMDGMLKRTADVLLSVLILCLIALPMLFIAIGVKLSSPGPVIFRQRRYGVDGLPIDVWKFRTMTVCENGEKVTQATRNDPRIKPYGAFLRKYSLDELPQFFNVLQGRMSIVGPRPHAVAHNELYRKDISQYMLRHKVKPGITGLAQISGCRGETDTLEKMERRVAYDLRYIQNWSLLLDVKVIFLTIFQVFRDPNAY
ncbi:Undecaprenyl-phosphate glucose phosphotransferase [Methylomonas methanica MC09]|uniref:Undecaprenyl-phosphate glucose phosphotransferase n=2 Tax=Methylomonas methanica TaxID=421 RepID=G0A233_METMM|nr:Undecaprenyl-phosphate glucose phosphotransferase [Methylomonas methanica MC09]